MHEFRDATRLASWTQLILIVFALFMFWAAFSDMLQLRLLYTFDNGAFKTIGALNQAVAANDARQHVTGPLRLAAYALSGILILVWTYRANANARGLGAATMRITPAWSVGWYFVPIANLVKPYDAMREIWRASAHPQGWSQETDPLSLRWWWVFLLLAIGLGVMALLLGMRAKGIETVIDATWLMLVSDLAGILSAGILLGIIAQVQQLQQAAFLASAPPALPGTEAGGG